MIVNNKLKIKVAVGIGGFILLEIIQASDYVKEELKEYASELDSFFSSNISKPEKTGVYIFDGISSHDEVTEDDWIRSSQKGEFLLVNEDVVLEEKSNSKFFLEPRYIVYKMAHLSDDQIQMLQRLPIPKLNNSLVIEGDWPMFKDTLDKVAQFASNDDVNVDFEKKVEEVGNLLSSAKESL